MLQKQSSVESQWLDSTIVSLFLIPHVQCKLVGASLPQSLGTQIDRGSIILSLYSQEHMTFFVRGTDSWRVSMLALLHSDLEMTHTLSIHSPLTSTSHMAA